jgi:hypothetical protein
VRELCTGISVARQSSKHLAVLEAANLGVGPGPLVADVAGRMIATALQDAAYGADPLQHGL